MLSKDNLCWTNSLFPGSSQIQVNFNNVEIYYKNYGSIKLFFKWKNMTNLYEVGDFWKWGWVGELHHFFLREEDSVEDFGATTEPLRLLGDRMFDQRAQKLSSRALKSQPLIKGTFGLTDTEHWRNPCFG